MVNLPKISIITPSYNQDHCIEECILSVINQDYSNIEFIIIDGKSTDNSVEIIKKYADQITYWVSESDKGIYDAMNKGIEKATGDWLYFLGTDDKLQKGVISQIFCYENLEECNFLYGEVESKNTTFVHRGTVDYANLFERNLCHQVIFYHKNLFENLGNYNKKYKLYADWDFNIRCFTYKHIKPKYVDKIVCTYSGEGISSHTIDEVFKKEKLPKYINKFLVKVSTPDVEKYKYHILDAIRQKGFPYNIKTIILYLYRKPNLLALKSLYYLLLEKFESSSQ
ncbi:glycosyltransferase family 2 protein [Bernardetia sp. MNP-M8]|uniref:glycosyltransferase family 2 protein n=1 Tax=Bernardetia sp. MNP-M8 TaxID=3127470 RepID=UPI0030CC5DAB